MRQIYWDLIDIANNLGLTRFIFIDEDNKFYLVEWNGVKWSDPQSIQYLS